MLSVCRLCLAEKADFNIFNGQAAFRIGLCTSLEVHEDDEMPQFICSVCRVRLEEFYHFRRRCQAADRRLRRFKRQEPRPEKIELDDELELQDVSRCVPTTCSESNAQWRLQAAQLIRTEMEAHKKDLQSICRQQVRDEIEQQVRLEVEDLLLAEAKKQCRLSVLDDLFSELERFFIKKRNEAVYSHVHGSECYGSDSETVELDSVSTQVGVDEGGNYYETENHEGNVLEILDDDIVIEPTVVQKAEDGSDIPDASPAIVPMAMVEINMQDSQLNHLREDYSGANFLTPASSPAKSTKQKSSFRKRVRFQSPPTIYSPAAKKSRQIVCRKHKQRYSYEPENEANCVRCRLRGADKLNVTVS